MENNEGQEIRIKPLQRISYEDKIKDDYQWFRKSADLFIGLSAFSDILVGYNGIANETRTEFGNLRKLYHNELTTLTFEAFTNPLNTKNKNYTPKGAKFRPFNILNSNLNYINSNYRKRVFNWSCVNLDPNVYNEFQENFKKNFSDQIIKRFTQLITDENGEKQQVDLTPETVKANFSLSYKDELADKAQRYLDTLMEQNHVQEILSEQFLDYLIYGEPICYTGIRNGNIEYRRVDRRFFEYDKSVHNKYISEAEWQVELELLTVSEVVDKYNLTEEDWTKLDRFSAISAESFKRYIADKVIASNYASSTVGKIPVYHCFWKSRKKVGTVVYYDEDGVLTSKKVDETYKVDERYETVEWKWENCIYKADRIVDLYLNMGEYEYPCINGVTGKLMMPYNGVKFAHYYDEKIYSLLKIGIPYLSMVLICNFMIEKMLSKNKGKIFVIDYGVVPKDEGWDEEKFMYYMEMLGYAFIKRDQIGADKTFNQYQAVDMSTLKDISELINLANSYKASWDDVAGIPRQLKGQTFASDQVGTTNASINQSSIIIDYIYQKFDDYTLRQVEYFLELSKYLLLEEEHTSTYSDDGFKLLNLKPEEMWFSKLKIVPVNNAKENRELEEAKAYAKTANQNSPLEVIEILTANNISQLKKQLNKIAERLQQEQEQASQNDHERQKELIEQQKDVNRFQLELDMQLENLKHDNKLEEIRENNLSSGLSKIDNDKDGIPDILEVQMKQAIENRKLDVKEREISINKQIADERNATELKKNQNKPSK